MCKIHRERYTFILCKDMYSHAGSTAQKVHIQTDVTELTIICANEIMVLSKRIQSHFYGTLTSRLSLLTGVSFFKSKTMINN